MTRPKECSWLSINDVHMGKGQTMKTISVLLCVICIGCTAVSPPAPMMLAPAPTPTLAVTTAPMSLSQAVVTDDDEVCMSGGE
jgi:hypothetical protein